MIGTKDVVQIALTQVTIVDAGGDAERPFDVRRNRKFVAHQRGPSGLDGVVVGHGMNGPDLVVIDEFAGEIHGPVGEAVGTGI